MASSKRERFFQQALILIHLSFVIVIIPCTNKKNTRFFILKIEGVGTLFLLTTGKLSRNSRKEFSIKIDKRPKWKTKEIPE